MGEVMRYVVCKWSHQAHPGHSEVTRTHARTLPIAFPCGDIRHIQTITRLQTQTHKHAYAHARTHTRTFGGESSGAVILQAREAGTRTLVYTHSIRARTHDTHALSNHIIFEPFYS